MYNSEEINSPLLAMERSKTEKLAFLPEKPVLSAEALDEVWNARGMRHRVDEIHVSLLSRGLLPSVDREAFRHMIKVLLEQFLVVGKSKPDPRLAPKPRFPKVH